MYLFQTKTHPYIGLNTNCNVYTSYEKNMDNFIGTLGTLSLILAKNVTFALC